ncbi:MAG: urease accessory protein UreD [Pseudomonadota bacterium]
MTASLAVPSPCAKQPRAEGHVRLSSKLRDATSVIDGLHQRGSLKLLFPRSRGTHLDAVLLNTAGGVTGGDRYDVALRAGSGTHISATTQAAERAYRAQPGEIGDVRTRVTIDGGARLDWVPQETILFDGSALNRRFTADLTSDGQLLLVEPVVFGRHAMGETLTAGQIRDRIDIRRDGELVFADRTAMTGAMAALLARPGVAAGAGAMATVIYVAADAGRFLDTLRAGMPATGGVSLVRKGVLFARLLAPDSFTLRRHLIPLIETLSITSLPRTWTI